MSKSPPVSENFVPDGEFVLPRSEEKVLNFWRRRGIFQKSMALRKRGRKFVFFEGPPTANGKPGIHHILARVYKDIILRYQTMRGFYVPRRSGWDTHGLPVEIQVEKELGLKSKKDIEQYGIGPFNQKCRESVWRHKDEFEKMTERIGFWLDLDHPYVTYETSYIESLWWIIQRIWSRKLLYRGHKVVPWCSRCGTALSSHELAQGYKEVRDNSVFLKFHLLPGQKLGSQKTDGGTYILSWTTTPWTLPGNVALAIAKDVRYVAIRINKAPELLILAKDLVTKVFAKDEIEIVHEFFGKDLIGLKYQPLFNVAALHTDTAYRVYPADFVTTEDGTGVVHTAVMYGEDDYNLGVALNLPQHHTVGEDGRFTKDVPELTGRYVKDPETEKTIFNYLTGKGYLLRAETYAHEYPHCWRCGTPLLYYARSAWFIAVSKIKNKMVAANKNINWTPAHIRDGRFGEWLRDAKDWNFSRERYWGTPLPIWECAKCDAREVVGSLAELDRRAGGSRNQYWVMRHGFAESNLLGIHNPFGNEYGLTPKGIAAAKRTAQKIKRLKIDRIVASDVRRTRETAEIVAKALGDTPLVFDERLREINLGKYNGRSSAGYQEELPTYNDKFAHGPEGGESLRQLRTRVWSAVADLEKKYKGENILIISHEYPIWMLAQAAEGWSEGQAAEAHEARGKKEFIDTAELRPLPVRILPRNETGEADLHRPWIDSVKLVCTKCGGKMARVKEVVDVWYDSGSMPFAEEHWPFSGVKKDGRVTAKPRVNFAYPADYICEAMDQTRGWFYTLLAVAALLELPAPFKNVTCLGLINDKNGQKMSKSKGNIVDPWMITDKYGVDALRWYFFTVNPPGETKNFDELELQKSYRRYHLILWNSLVFWKTYADRGAIWNTKNKPKNILDRWVLARLAATKITVTTKLEKYEVREAALAIESLADDLSRWYIRRSRRRLQRPENRTDFRTCSAVLGYVLSEITLMTAPFTPFFAEVMYRELGGRAESVHLADWPLSRSPAGMGKTDAALIEKMAEVREVASLALAERAKAGIKVRQPLSELRVPLRKIKSGDREFLAILSSEVNVKKTIVSSKTKFPELNTQITPELKTEGTLREIVRAVQDLRQSAGFKPSDRIALFMEAHPIVQNAVSSNEKWLKNEIGAKTIELKRTDKFQAEASTDMDGQPLWLAVRMV